MAASSWVREMLNERGLPFVERHHPEAFTAQRVAQQEHVSGHHMAKVVVAIADGRPIELIVPACRRVLLDRVKQLLGAERVRLASESEMVEQFSDCELGAIPPLRHWPDVDVLMDTSLWVDGDILFQAGTHCDAVQMRFNDWASMVQPRVEFFTEPDIVPQQSPRLH